MKHRAFFRSVAIVTAGGVVAKGIGALYRILLSGALGGYGMGLYHMAYPLFLVLLTFSSSGTATAVSRLVARERAGGRENGNIPRLALRLFALLGLLGSAAMLVIAPHLAGFQGEGGLLRCYFALAPSVFFVALIAVLRGYFQGKNDMVPTASSEVLEQLIKGAAGLVLSYRFRADPALSAAGALFGVTLSECAACMYLLIRYGGERHSPCLTARPLKGTELLSAAFPVMAAASLLPLSQMADSVVIVRLLSGGTERAVSLYGLYSGGALSLAGLPATACCGLAAAIVPAVSSACARKDEAEARRRAVYALALTLALAVPCAAALYLFAGQIVRFLYPALGAGEKEILVSLVRLMSVSAATLAGVDTLAACLAGMGRARYAALSMLVAVAVKCVLQFILIPNPAFSVGGAAIAANACYLVAFSLDLVYTVKKRRQEKERDHDRKSRRGAGGFDLAGGKQAENGGRGGGTHRRGAFGADA